MERWSLSCWRPILILLSTSARSITSEDQRPEAVLDTSALLMAGGKDMRRGSSVDLCQVAPRMVDLPYILRSPVTMRLTGFPRAYDSCKPALPTASKVCRDGTPSRGCARCVRFTRATQRLLGSCACRCRVIADQPPRQLARRGQLRARLRRPLAIGQGRNFDGSPHTIPLDCELTNSEFDQ